MGICKTRNGRGNRKWETRNEEMGGNGKWCTQKWEQIFKGGEVTELVKSSDRSNSKNS